LGKKLEGKQQLKQKNAAVVEKMWTAAEMLGDMICILLLSE
jgi:roadblock/LC7 domain-containing protein